MKREQEFIFKQSAFLLVAALILYCIVIGWSQLYGESLWRQGSTDERGLFSDKVAAARGDILTIVVSESNNMSQSIRTTTDKSSTINNAVNQWLFTPAASQFGTHEGELPATDITGENDYEGGGQINNSHTVSGRISVTVMDVLPNKNLVIEGVRVVTFSGETQFAVLRGVVRPYDLSASNTIGSDRVADATVQFISEGSLSEAQKKGWLMKFNDMVNPF